MENDIAIYALGYLGLRLAAVAAFGFAIYQMASAARGSVRAQPARARASARAYAVADDRC